MRDVVIVGAGLAGASTAWHLARRGREVTVLERTTPANAFGSSHGSARILRYAYPDQFYTDLVVRARIGWDELERESGRTLITPTGAIDHGDRRDPRHLAQVLARAGVDHELVSADEAQQRWPQLTFTSEALWHPAAGVLDADGTVDAMLSLAEQTGYATLLTDWEVQRVEAIRGGYRLHSNTGETVDAKHLVLAVGAWLPALLADLPLSAAVTASLPPFVVRQEQAFHFPYRELDAGGGSDAAPVKDAAFVAVADASPWPSFVHMTPDLTVYGLPGGRDADYRGQKIAEYNGGKVISSGWAQDGIVSSENRARVAEYVTHYVPGVDAEHPYAEKTCLFTTTPTEDFVIDRIENIVLLSACSGHGAKFAPLLGELAADLLTESRNAIPRFAAVTRLS